MNIESYIQRINYSGEIKANLDSLRKLQAAHLLSIPFENLDIHLGKRINLDFADFYRKIVVHKRGGFCYELNGLFYHLLKGLGFETRIISAKVFNDKTASFGEEFDHLALIVTMDNIEYLVDVGFGEFALHPLTLDLGKVQSDPRGKFIVDKQGDYFQISSVIDDLRTLEYKFLNKPRKLNEFSGMCTFHQTSLHSHFTQKKLITQATSNGRVTLTETRLKVTQEGVLIFDMELKPQEYPEMLEKWFGIVL